MQDEYEVIAGSVTGKDHRRAGKNNQDGFCFQINDGSIIGIVTDGCGTRDFSQIGSVLGSRLAVETINQNLGRFGIPVYNELPINTLDFWDAVKQDLVLKIGSLACQLGLTEMIVDNYFLFTIVGCLILPTMSYFFSFGDGFIVVNGEIEDLGPFPNNAPPYLGQLLRRNAGSLMAGFKCSFHPTHSLQSFMIATDGLREMIQSEHLRLPGREDEVGPISQFWTDDDYFSNPDQLRRRLALINREVIVPDWANQDFEREWGHLSDDTTILVGRKRSRREEE